MNHDRLRYGFPGLVVVWLCASIALRCTSSDLVNRAVPFDADARTRGLWHLDESTGSMVVDASAGWNHGRAFGTTIVAGKFGNARAFNGVSDFIAFPPDAKFDFGTSSFRIDLWFRTHGQPGGVLIRRGLAPEPGFQISMAYGHVFGMIGNREDSTWPDAIISVRSDSTFDDNQWHRVSLVRDRSVHKLILFVDGAVAAEPADDWFTIPLTSRRPLTIGRWENSGYPWFFWGEVDEVRVTTGEATSSTP